MSVLTREEWNQLDDLLAKHGVGGYYDFVGCLKMVIADYGGDNLKDGWSARIKTLPDAFEMLMAVHRNQLRRLARGER